MGTFQAIDCTGTDDQTATKRKYTNHKITNPNTNELALVKIQKKHTQKLNLNVKQFTFKNCSYQCAYDCAQLLQNTSPNSSDNVPSYPPDNHHSSDVV